MVFLLWQPMLTGTASLKDKDPSKQTHNNNNSVTPTNVSPGELVRCGAKARLWSVSQPVGSYIALKRKPHLSCICSYSSLMWNENLKIFWKI